MDVYRVIQPPFKTLDTTDMSKVEIREYYEWFIKALPERVAVLEQAVNSTTGYEEWRADYLPDSLLRLSVWFSKSVSTRVLTPQEKLAMCADGPDWFGPDALADWELTQRTFSLCVDIGMYLGEVLVRNNPELRWRLISTGSKRYVDYGRPVVGPLKVCDFNPVSGVIMIAYGTARRGYMARTLEWLYDIQIARKGV